MFKYWFQQYYLCDPFLFLTFCLLSYLLSSVVEKTVWEHNLCHASSWYVLDIDIIPKQIKLGTQNHKGNMKTWAICLLHCIPWKRERERNREWEELAQLWGPPSISGEKRKNPQEKSIARKGGILNHSDLFCVLDEKIVRSGQEKKYHLSPYHFPYIPLYSKAVFCTTRNLIQL